MERRQRYHVIVSGSPRAVEIVADGGEFEIRIDDRVYRVDDENLGHPDFHSLLIDHKSYSVITRSVSRSEGRYTARIRGRIYDVRVYDELQAAAARQREEAEASEDHVVRSPMPGMVAGIKVNVGDRVRAGDPVIVVEAMKMQNELASPFSGCVKRIHVREGQSVESKAQLLVIEPLQESAAEEAS
jgi:biotin carboxyl carrier protein